jgi:F-type H+-transporting ATPase subunit alpha
MEWTIIVAAPSHFPAAYLYIAPYAGAAIGEYFMDKGEDALVIYDNLTAHALAWRQLSLILQRPPGREAYPGDIFYLHSRLLERAAKLNPENGGGSLTAIPIIETLEGDVTSYIPTNVISICDGQIVMDTTLYHRGRRPEVNIGLSVSRVGSNAQTKAMKKVARTLKLDLAQLQELETFLEFSEEVEAATKKRIEKGRKLREILKQRPLAPLSFEKETVIIFAGTENLLEDISLGKIGEFEEELFQLIELEQPEIFEAIKKKKELEPAIEDKLRKIILELRSKYAPSPSQIKD